MNIREKCIESYSRLKNLKLVEAETGIKWQTVYWNLRQAGISVSGDKKRYGSTTDKLAQRFEVKFKEMVPFAKDNNGSEWQSKVDFNVNGLLVDVKVGKLQPSGRNPSGKSFSARWGFCINKQKDIADFFVLFAVDEKEDVQHIFLIPNEMAVNHTTISIPFSMRSKWADFEISANDLVEFFKHTSN